MTGSQQDEFNELISELGDWNGGRGIEPDAWIGCVGNYELAIGYSLIFWPPFVVIDDYVLRGGTTEELLRSWEKSTAGDRSATEAVINHVHMADIHYNAADPTEAQLRYLGRVLTKIHETKLAVDFPDRQFVVSFPDEPGLDLLDYELTFWEVRS